MKHKHLKHKLTLTFTYFNFEIFKITCDITFTRFNIYERWYVHKSLYKRFLTAKRIDSFTQKVELTIRFCLNSVKHISLLQTDIAFVILNASHLECGTKIKISQIKLKGWLSKAVFKKYQVIQTAILAWP